MTAQTPVPSNSSENNGYQNDSRDWWSILKLLGAYLAGAWTLLQFLEWIFTRNQISPYWVDIFLWIFIGLLPSFLFYLFHKQRIDTWRLKQKDKILFSSNLLALILILFFAFRSTDLGATTKEIQYITNDGTSKSQKIVKQEFRKSINLFTFEGIGVDSAMIWLQKGIPNLLRYDAQQDKAVIVSVRFDKLSVAAKIKAADAYDFYVDGTYTVKNGIYTVTPEVHKAKNGKLLAKKSFSGSDLFLALDSVSVYIRQEVGINEAMMEASVDLPLKDFTSSSLEAIQSFTACSSAGFERALKLDSTFALANLELGVHLFKQDVSDLDTRFYLDRAYRHRHKLPFDLQYSVLSYRQMAYHNLEAAEKTLQLQLEIDPESLILNRNLAHVYKLSNQVEKLLEFTKAWSERSGSAALMNYGEALIVNGKTDEILKLTKPLRILMPKNRTVLYGIFIAHYMDKNWEEALEILQKMKLINPELEPSLNLFEKSVRYQKDQTPSSEQYGDFINDFRRFASSQTSTIYPHATKDHFVICLMNYDITFYFPLEKDQLLETNGWFTMRTHQAAIDSNEQFYGFQSTPYVRSKNKREQFFWKIDSLILHAESLLKNRAYDKAALAYQKAIEANPNHYFLKDALAHIQYIQSKSPADLQKQYQSITGTYGDRNFWMEGNHLIYKRKSTKRYFPKMELFPLSENRYINLTRQHIQLAFEYEGAQAITSYSYIYNLDSFAWILNTNKEDIKFKNEL